MQTTSAEGIYGSERGGRRVLALNRIEEGGEKGEKRERFVVALLCCFSERILFFSFPGPRFSYGLGRGGRREGKRGEKRSTYPLSPQKIIKLCGGLCERVLLPETVPTPFGCENSF